MTNNLPFGGILTKTPSGPRGPRVQIVYVLIFNMLTPYKDIGGIIEKTNLSSLRQGYNDSAELVTASDSELETNGLRRPAIRRLRRALFMPELCPRTMSELLLRACLGGVVDALVCPLHCATTQKET